MSCGHKHRRREQILGPPSNEPRQWNRLKVQGNGSGLERTTSIGFTIPGCPLVPLPDRPNVKKYLYTHGDETPDPGSRLPIDLGSTRHRH